MISYNKYEVNARKRLRYFCRKNLTLEQAKKLFTLFENCEELFYQLCQAYNDYTICRGERYFSLIINPDVLFRTPEAEQEFIKEIKNYIMDVIGIKREDVENGKATDNRAE